MKKVLIVGGAGFIGSNLVKDLLKKDERIVIVDNLKNGNLNFIQGLKKSDNIKLLKQDIKNWKEYKKELEGIDTIIHLASNADISLAESNPSIDFYEGAEITQAVADLGRHIKAKQIIYASGSGVYGDRANFEFRENQISTLLISPYAASKLYGESILNSYGYLFGINIISLRFANVVGPNQTHGIGLDLLLKLKKDNKVLKVLGDGTQKKNYIYVDDIIGAIDFLRKKNLKGNHVFNVCTEDLISVFEIVNIALNVSNIKYSEIKIDYGISNRGWKGDVPYIKMSNVKLRSLGWRPKLETVEAVTIALWNLKMQIEDGTLKV